MANNVTSGGSRFGGSLNPEYDFILQYIEEAVEARKPIVKHTERAIQAYYGMPSEDRYLGRIKSLIGQFMEEDSDRAKAIEDACKNVRPRQNFTIMRAVNTLVAQASGGVSQYEAVVFDPYFKKDQEIVDKINEAAKYIYIDNHVDSMLPQGIEFAALSGEVYTLIEKKKGSDKELDLTWIPSTEMLLDPVRMKRNNQRYIGHQTFMSWRELKEFIKKGKNGTWTLEAINAVDNQLIEVRNLVNKYTDYMSLSKSPEYLNSGLDVYYSKSIRAFYDSEDTDYIADEVEVSYLYDLINRKKYTVINREFIVRVETDYLKGGIHYTLPQVDSYTGEVFDKDNKVDIKVDHPYVALTNKRSLWANYGYSNIVSLLDSFDDICALESLIYHTISIMTPITFTGNPTDVEKLAGIAGVSGEIIKGFIGNSVSVVNKAVDLTPALSEIQRLESTIKWVLNGPDAKEQAEMMGDRASGTEASLASSSVTQGLAPFMANIEQWAGELASKMFKFLAIYNGDDWEYEFPKDYRTVTLSKQDILGEIHFRAILKNRIKVEQRQQANMTMQWFVPMAQSDVIKNKEQMFRDIVPTLAEGFSRRQIASWFEESPEVQRMKEMQMEQAELQLDFQKRQLDNNEIDLSYVDPSSGGELGQVDISRALSPDSYDDSYDMSMEEPGVRRPQPTSRKLQYGLTPQPEADTVPFAKQFPSVNMPAVEEGEIPNSDVAEMLSGMLAGGTAGKFDISQSTAQGGIAANDPLVGKNSVEGGRVNA